jgi:hypothetical protein
MDGYLGDVEAQLRDMEAHTGFLGLNLEQQQLKILMSNFDRSS